MEPSVYNCKRSIADLLKTEIEDFSNRLQQSHPLMAAARAGQLQPETVMQYLTGIRYLLRHSWLHLHAARSQMVSRGNLELAAFYCVKAQQELGHDRWADNDINEMVSVFGLAVPDAPDTMKAMVDYIESLIQKKPSHYAVYIFFAEYFMVHAGAPWAEALVKNCGIPRRALSAVTKHVELDKHHVHEGMLELDRIFATFEGPQALLETLRESMRQFENFCDELFAHSRRSAVASQAARAPSPS